MTLRQLMVRMRALSPESLLHRVVRAELEAAAAAQEEQTQVQDIDDAIDMIRRQSTAREV